MVGILDKGTGRAGSNLGVFFPCFWDHRFGIMFIILFQSSTPLGCDPLWQILSHSKKRLDGCSWHWVFSLF